VGSLQKGSDGMLVVYHSCAPLMHIKHPGSLGYIAAVTCNIVIQMVLTVCIVLQAVSIDSVCSQCGSPVLAASSAPVTAGLHQSPNHCCFSTYAGPLPVLDSLALLHDALQCLCPIRHGLSTSMHASCNAQKFTSWRPGFDWLSCA